MRYHINIPKEQNRSDQILLGNGKKLLFVKNGKEVTKIVAEDGDTAESIHNFLFENKAVFEEIKDCNDNQDFYTLIDYNREINRYDVLQDQHLDMGAISLNIVLLLKKYAVSISYNRGITTTIDQELRDINWLKHHIRDGNIPEFSELTFLPRDCMTLSTREGNELQNSEIITRQSTDLILERICTDDEILEYTEAIDKIMPDGKNGKRLTNYKDYTTPARQDGKFIREHTEYLLHRNLIHELQMDIGYDIEHYSICQLATNSSVKVLRLVGLVSSRPAKKLAEFIRTSGVCHLHLFEASWSVAEHLLYNFSELPTFPLVKIFFERKNIDELEGFDELKKMLVRNREALLKCDSELKNLSLKNKVIPELCTYISKFLGDSIGYL